MKPDCIVTLHDSNLNPEPILNAERFLDRHGITNETVLLPDTVAVMGLGRLATAVRDQLQPHALDRETSLDRWQRQLWSHIASVHSRQNDAELEHLRSDNSRLVEEIERARKASQEAQARQDAITSSTTWRASAPVRAVVDRIKRGLAR
jgi:hypothetical protein